MRYSLYPFHGWYAFRNGNALYVHHLAAYPPDSANQTGLSVAFRAIVFALEQDPWTHAKPPPPRSPRDFRRATDFVLMLNVSENESYDSI